jgi:hypothetical protein
MGGNSWADASAVAMGKEPDAAASNRRVANMMRLIGNCQISEYRLYAL